MSSFRYLYSGDLHPIPVAAVNLNSPADERGILNCSALIYTGADQTVIPIRHLRQMGIDHVSEEKIQRFDGVEQKVRIYVCSVQIRDFRPVNIEVIAHDLIPYVILGRDLLNRFRMVLDGPNRMMEIFGD